MQAVISLKFIHKFFKYKTFSANNIGVHVNLMRGEYYFYFFKTTVASLEK